ncbi:hypothetical protein BJ166DRAFT_308259 [Pestalotiopsis sp. NC0098]|nr:hypothetical protein BJ166DRAFT_308259 [Pestalotiopsis sp. NC0098]
MPSSQRPNFFLSSFLAAFRQQAPPASALSTSSQPNKHSHHHLQTSAASAAASGARPISTSTAAASSTSSAADHQAGSVINQIPIHSPRAHHGGVPIPGSSAGRDGGGRRRGSDSSSEGFRDVIGGDKWYIGGRTAGGEEKFFKLGVVRRIKSNDRLSLDRLSL